MSLISNVTQGIKDWWSLDNKTLGNYGAPEHNRHDSSKWFKTEDTGKPLSRFDWFITGLRPWTTVKHDAQSNSAAATAKSSYEATPKKNPYVG